MAHITEFSVDGLAGRTEVLSGKLNRDINVFCGLNGSGKTSLLKIFHWAMKENADPLWVVPFKRAEVSLYSIMLDSVIKYSCEKPDEAMSESGEQEVTDLSQNLVFYSSTGTVHPEPRLKWQIEPPRTENETIGWTHSFLPTSRLYLSSGRPKARSGRGYSLPETSEEELEESFATTMNQVWSSYSAQVLGGVQRAQAKGLADILVGILSGRSSRAQSVAELDPLTAYERVAKFLERQQARDALGDRQTFQADYLSNPQLRSVVGDINKVELQIQEEMAPREKLKALLEKMFTGNKSIRFTDSSIEILGAAKKKIGLERLSSGEKQLIRMLIGTLLVGPSSIMIDEPEISLHVDWQKQLVQAMRQLNPTAQLILATHSPEISAEIPDDKIFYL